MNLQEIKYKRLSIAEQFLFGLLPDLVEYCDINHSKSIFYMRNNEVLFVYNLDDKSLYYSYKHIFRIFTDVFKFKYIDTSKVIRRIMEQHINVKFTTTIFTEFFIV